ncbi:MAG: endonuclease/exonuclease/phosphatase family protein [Bacteroidota bacterium]|nr:endonuclease/exonuclease/phosphatase family protein [Bacteroidota bacterium]
MMRIAIALCVCFLALGAVAQEPVELITYNIRMNTSGDGEHAWPYRKDDVAALFRFHRADIFCVQEALPEQMDDLDAAFPDFTYEGIGRDDGKREGEFSAVFYNHKRFKKLDGGTFWLSETPEACSFGWDAACRRVCSWVKLKDEVTGEILQVFNTHFDHRGEVARRESAQLILDKIEEISEGKGRVVLCGDFNLSPGSEPIALIGSKLQDAFLVSEQPPYASVATYHGFTYDDPPKERIDYVFVSNDLKVLRYGGLTDSRDRSFFSDHLPVLVTIQLVN